MADQHHGYDVSLGYPSYFIREMAPDWVDFCVRASGQDVRRTGSAYRYLDLGCGQGFHLCLLAAANPHAEFVGVDFDPDFIAHGRKLAAAGDLSNVTFVEADFLDLAASWPSALGKFGYIALQGILSWISPELRGAVLQCVSNASKPGTLAYFGYNVLPGWLGAMPFQHIASELSKSGEAEAALDGTVAMFHRLRSINAPLFEQMPRFKRQLDRLTAQPKGYLAHEFLPGHWMPLWHSTIARQLQHHDFTYVGSGTVAEALLPDSLPPELRAVIAEQDDPVLRQDVQDIVILQQFRRDIFCRDPRPGDGGTAYAETPIYLLSAPPQGAPVQFKTSFGGLTVEYAVVADILMALADGPKTIGELMALDNPARPAPRSILLSMIESHMLAIGLAEPASIEPAARFNAAVARAAAGGEQYRNLAAAALGSGIVASELDMLVLDAWLSAQGRLEAPALAAGVAQRLRSLGRQLQFRGSPVPDEQLESHVANLMPAYIDEKLPYWRALGVLQ